MQPQIFSLQQSDDGSLSGSTCLEFEPPSDSRLAQSLNRGRFSETFGEYEVIGSGAYGTVVKAWHLKERCWYAVKMISAKVRAEDTIDENYEAWSGPEIFNTLRGLRSPHVVKYIRYWSEMHADLPCSVVVGCSPLPSPKLEAAAAPSVLGELPVVSSRLLFGTEDAAPDQGDLTGYSFAASDGGFEWATPTQKSDGDFTAEPFRQSPSSISPKQTHYRVMLLEQMEYCEGITLATWLAEPGSRPGLSTSCKLGVLEMFTQVMKGLADMHAAGIVHCDIKPSNIMITTPGAKVKFFDFGTAKLKSKVSQRQGSRAPLSPSDQEGSCTALGTPGYAAPEHCCFRRQTSDGSDSVCSEVFRSRAAAPGADIFSAGVILVELLMATVSKGVAWITAMEKAKALAQIRTGRGGALPIAILRAPGIEGWMRQLVLRMVVWDAEVRPAASEVLDELEVGLWAASRRNPNVGTQHPRSPQLGAMMCPFSAAHNPYIGYFLDHRRLGGV